MPVSVEMTDDDSARPQPTQLRPAFPCHVVGIDTPRESAPNEGTQRQKPTAGTAQTRDLARGRDRDTDGEVEMQTEIQPRELASRLDGRGKTGSVREHRSCGDGPGPMRLDDSPGDAVGESEVVRIDDHPSLSDTGLADRSSGCAPGRRGGCRHPAPIAPSSARSRTGNEPGPAPSPVRDVWR